jgi:hypothetical protein
MNFVSKAHYKSPGYVTEVVYIFKREQKRAIPFKKFRGGIFPLGTSVCIIFVLKTLAKWCTLISKIGFIELKQDQFFCFFINYFLETFSLETLHKNMINPLIPIVLKG